MKQKKTLRTKIGNQVIVLGLSSVAVLMTIVEAATRVAVSFPGRGTSLRRVLNNLEKHHAETGSIIENLDFLKEISGYNLSVILHRLREKGLVQKINKEYKLTTKGKSFLEKISKNYKGGDKNKKWDGKWRLITFDIPERFRKDRDWLRHSLRATNYKTLHKSVFVGKEPLDDEIYKELYEKKINKYVRIVTVGEIDEGGFD